MSIPADYQTVLYTTPVGARKVAAPEVVCLIPARLARLAMSPARKLGRNVIEGTARVLTCRFDLSCGRFPAGFESQRHRDSLADPDRNVPA
jgi:hypothetical protein